MKEANAENDTSFDKNKDAAAEHVGQNIWLTCADENGEKAVLETEHAHLKPQVLNCLR
jgi:hypothetical protein